MIITKDQIKQYQHEGFMVVPKFLENEKLEMVRNVCDTKVAETEKDMRNRGVEKDRINVLGKKYFIHQPHKTHPSLENIIFSNKVAEVCKATIGDTAYLHSEQFVVKMTDSNTNFAWHQDSGYSVYQGGAQEHTPYLTCWIALDDMSEKNGTISVLPFSRSPSRQLIKHTWDDDLSAMVGYNGEDDGDLVEVPAGTLVAFSSFLLHKSGANSTDRPRRSYFIAFTPELFMHSDESKGVYSSGEPVIQDGLLVN